MIGVRASLIHKVGVLEAAPTVRSVQVEQLDALVFRVPPIIAGYPGEYVTEGESQRVPKIATAPVNEPLQMIT